MKINLFGENASFSTFPVVAALAGGILFQFLLEQVYDTEGIRLTFWMIVMAIGFGEVVCTKGRQRRIWSWITCGAGLLWIASNWSHDSSFQFLNQEVFQWWGWSAGYVLLSFAVTRVSRSAGAAVAMTPLALALTHYFFGGHIGYFVAGSVGTIVLLCKAWLRVEQQTPEITEDPPSEAAVENHVTCPAPLSDSQPKPESDGPRQPSETPAPDLDSGPPDSSPRNGVPQEIEELARDFTEVHRAITSHLFGIEPILKSTLATLLAGGHLLFEGNPGLGKTSLVKMLGTCLGLHFCRGQFTPDLLPSDLTGERIFDRVNSQFKFRPGPVFCHLFLADEINRAPAKTQAALLEAMEEMQVTIAGESRALGAKNSVDGCSLDDLPAKDGRLFMVLATQNPFEQEGTYSLPEAQLDRFTMRLFFPSPDATIIRQIVETGTSGARPDLVRQPILSYSDILSHRQAVRRRVEVPEHIRDLIADLVVRTHGHPNCLVGASPRAAQALVACSTAAAALDARAVVTEADVLGIARDILNHRIVLTQEVYYDSESEDPRQIVDGVLDDILEAR